MRTIPDIIKPEFFRLYGKPLEIYELYLNSPYTTPSHYFVANNEDIVFGGTTYTAIALKRTAIKSENGTIVNEIELGLDNIDLEFRNLIAAGIFDRKRCLIKLIFANLLTTESNYVLLMDGMLDAPKGDERWCTVTITPFPMLEREYPRRIFQVGCNHKFCDSSCGLTLSDYGGPVVTTSGCTPLVLQITPPVTENYFSYGYAEIQSGDLIGQMRPIVSNTVSTVTVRIPFDGEIVAGVTVHLQKLCLKTTDECGTTYNNYLMYGGFPHVPKTPTF